MRVTVVGAGSWGTALAMVLVEGGHDVCLWSWEAEVANAINERSVNPYLEGVTLPAGLRADSDLAAAVRGADLVVSVSPSQVVRSVMEVAAPHLKADAVLVSASKGIELSSSLRMDEVLEQILSPGIMERFCVLSGPSFAKEVAERQPTAVVVGSREQQIADLVQDAFQTPWFRVYTNLDVIGVELGGGAEERHRARGGRHGRHRAWAQHHGGAHHTGSGRDDPARGRDGGGQGYFFTGWLEWGILY